jgi:AcrR family transcriptional regulator
MMCAALGATPSAQPYFADFVEGTMREIAARVGVSEPAIYRHYESKEAILADIVATAGDRISGQIVRQFGTLTADNVSASLLEIIELRRDMAEKKRAARGNERTGAGSVLHVLFHAAPHNEHFLELMRQHLALPLVQAVHSAIPRVDEGFGITRPDDEVNARVRVFMSLFVGYFSTSIMFDAPPNDAAIVDALLGMMGWRAS